MSDNDKILRSRSVTVGVPAKSLASVKPVVDELHRAAGVPLSRPVLAERLKTRYTSSGFMQKMAAARYYGFIELQQEKAVLTPLGERFAKGDVAAAQEGFAASSFGPIARGLAGRGADLSTVALHLTDKNNVPSSSAERFAVILLRSAHEADLIRDNRFNAERLEALFDQKEHANDTETPNEVSQHHEELRYTPVAPMRNPLPPPVPSDPSVSIAHRQSLQSIEIAGGYSLTYPHSLPIDLLMSPDFRDGLASLKKAINALADRT